MRQNSTCGLVLAGSERLVVCDRRCFLGKLHWFILGLIAARLEIDRATHPPGCRDKDETQGEASLPNIRNTRYICYRKNPTLEYGTVHCSYSVHSCTFVTLARSSTGTSIQDRDLHVPRELTAIPYKPGLPGSERSTIFE